MKKELTPKEQWLLNKSQIAKEKRVADSGNEKLLQLQSDADDKVDSNWMLKMKQAMVEQQKEADRMTNQLLGNILLKYKEPKLKKPD